MKESERLKAILEAEYISMAELPERTGTNRNRWSHVKLERAKLRAEDGEELKKVFPEYQVWLMTEMEFPESGQHSPMTKLKIKKNE